MSLTTSHSVAFIPLNRLVPWSGNVRKTAACEGLEELAANIAANGLLQSLVVRKTKQGKYSVVAGRRRLMALSSLAEGGELAQDVPVPCKVISRSADATEISLSENVVRTPMHPADQFDAFRALAEKGSAPAEIAARFGIAEEAVRKRLKLARVSPVVFEAYRRSELTLEQVQAFAVSDDHAAQERVFAEMPHFDTDASVIRRALTQDDVPGTDKRARFVTVEAYEEAGGVVRRDLFTEGDNGVFLLDSQLLDRLAHQKLEAMLRDVRAEGWKWVEVHPDFDYEARGQFRRLHPEPLPLSDEAAAEERKLSQEYEAIYSALEEEDEEASARLDAIEARIAELEDRELAFTPQTLAIAGAVLTLSYDGKPEVVRGLLRPQDTPEAQEESGTIKARPDFSATLVQSLTERKTAAIGAAMAQHPHVALAAVTHALASSVFLRLAPKGSLQLSAQMTRLTEDSKGRERMEEAREAWRERLPADSQELLDWCLGQDRETLLSLLAFCAASTVDAVEGKHADAARIAHANAIASALRLDMAEWFSPTAANFFSRVPRPVIISAMLEAKGLPAKRSWEKMKKADLAVLAEREIAGTGWLPQPLRA